MAAPNPNAGAPQNQNQNQNQNQIAPGEYGANLISGHPWMTRPSQPHIAAHLQQSLPVPDARGAARLAVHIEGHARFTRGAVLDGQHASKGALTIERKVAALEELFGGPRFWPAATCQVTNNPVNQTIVELMHRITKAWLQLGHQNVWALWAAPDGPLYKAQGGNGSRLTSQMLEAALGEVKRLLAAAAAPPAGVRSAVPVPVPPVLNLGAGPAALPQAEEIEPEQARDDVSVSEAVSTDLIPAQANKADGITDQDDNDDGDVDMEQHLGADLGLDLTQAELARRHQSAVALLEENGVDPQSLSERHMAVFANQREEQQRASLQLIVDHGAERLRVVDPPQPEGEDVFGSPPPMQPQSPPQLQFALVPQSPAPLPAPNFDAEVEERVAPIHRASSHPLPVAAAALDASGHSDHPGADPLDRVRALRASIWTAQDYELPLERAPHPGLAWTLVPRRIDSAGGVHDYMYYAMADAWERMAPGVMTRREFNSLMDGFHEAMLRVWRERGEQE